MGMQNAKAMRFLTIALVYKQETVNIVCWKSGNVTCIRLGRSRSIFVLCLNLRIGYYAFYLLLV